MLSSFLKLSYQYASFDVSTIIILLQKWFALCFFLSKRIIHAPPYCLNCQFSINVPINACLLGSSTLLYFIVCNPFFIMCLFFFFRFNESHFLFPFFKYCIYATMPPTCGFKKTTYCLSTENNVFRFALIVIISFFFLISLVLCIALFNVYLFFNYCIYVAATFFCSICQLGLTSLYLPINNHIFS
jgi:hypothetical protein